MMRKDGISDAKYASLPLTVACQKMPDQFAKSMSFLCIEAQNAILDKPWLQNAFKGEQLWLHLTVNSQVIQVN